MEQDNIGINTTENPKITMSIKDLIERDPMELRLGLKGLVLFHANSSDLKEKLIALFYLTSCVILMIFSQKGLSNIRSFVDILLAFKNNESQFNAAQMKIAFLWINKIKNSKKIKRIFISVCDNEEDYKILTSILIDILEKNPKKAIETLKKNDNIKNILSDFLTCLLEDEQDKEIEKNLIEIRKIIDNILKSSLKDPRDSSEIQNGIQELLTIIPPTSLERLLDQSVFMLYPDIKPLILDPLLNFQNNIASLKNSELEQEEIDFKKQSYELLLGAEILKNFKEQPQEDRSRITKLTPVKFRKILEEINNFFESNPQSASKSQFEKLLNQFIQHPLDPKKHIPPVEIFDFIKTLHQEKRLEKFIELASNILENESQYHTVLENMSLILKNEKLAQWIFSSEMRNFVDKNGGEGSLNPVLESFKQLDTEYQNELFNKGVKIAGALGYTSELPNDQNNTLEHLHSFKDLLNLENPDELQKRNMLSKGIEIVLDFWPTIASLYAKTPLAHEIDSLKTLVAELPSRIFSNDVLESENPSRTFLQCYSDESIDLVARSMEKPLIMLIGEAFNKDVSKKDAPEIEFVSAALSELTKSYRDSPDPFSIVNFIRTHEKSFLILIKFIMQYQTVFIPLICKTLSIDIENKELVENFLIHVQEHPQCLYDMNAMLKYLRTLSLDQNLENLLIMKEDLLIDLLLSLPLDQDRLKKSKTLKPYVSHENTRVFISQEHKQALKKDLKTEFEKLRKNHSFSSLLIQVLDGFQNKNLQQADQFLNAFDENSLFISLVFKLETLKQKTSVNNIKTAKSLLKIANLFSRKKTQDSDPPSSEILENNEQTSQVPSKSESNPNSSSKTTIFRKCLNVLGGKKSDNTTVPPTETSTEKTETSTEKTETSTKKMLFSNRSGQAVPKGKPTDHNTGAPRSVSGKNNKN